MYKSNFKKCGNEGPKGDDGLTPQIGKNGNWFLGDVDTGVKAQGPRGMRGFQGEQGIQGIQGIQGEKGEKGDKGSNVVGIRTDLTYTKDELTQMCVIGSFKDYDITTSGLVNGDIVFAEVTNSTTEEKVILFLKITELYSSIRFRGQTIGCAIKEKKRLDYPFMVCETSFDPHTTEQIDGFSQLGHKESFDISQINNLDPIELHQQLGLLIPNSSTGNNSIYFGFVTSITESSVVCDSIGCIHGGIKMNNSVFTVPQNGTFKELKVKLNKMGNIVRGNMEVTLTTEPNIGERWFIIPEGFRPVGGGTSFYTIFGGAIIRCAVMPNGDLQMIEKVMGEMKIGMDYTVTFNYAID